MGPAQRLNVIYLMDQDLQGTYEFRVVTPQNEFGSEGLPSEGPRLSPHKGKPANQQQGMHGRQYIITDVSRWFSIGLELVINFALVKVKSSLVRAMSRPLGGAGKRSQPYNYTESDTMSNCR